MSEGSPPRKGPSFLLYVRQSITRTSGDDESLSIAFQERALRELVANKGGVVLEPVIIDADQKGWDPNRPGIASLMERVEQERPAAIAVYAMSRFARDNWLQEGLWRKAKSLQPDLVFCSVTEPNAEDDMVRGILGVISQAERKRMGVFLAGAFRERARRGLPHGYAPFGFGKDDAGRLVPDPDTASILEGAIAHVEDGWSLWRTTRWLNEVDRSGRTWEPTGLKRLLTRPAIAGGVQTADVLTWDAHEGIIDRDRYERLQTLLATRRRTRTKEHSSWLEGLIRCGCGEPMYLTRLIQGPRETHQFRCFTRPGARAVNGHPACTFRPRSIMQGAAETATCAALVRDLGAILSPAEVYAQQVARFAQDAAGAGHERHGLERAITKAEAERARLLVLYTRGTLDVARWEDQDAQFGARLDTLAGQLAALPVAPNRKVTIARWETLSALAERTRHLVEADPASVRAVLQSVGAVVVRTAAGVRIQWPPELAPFVGTTLPRSL